MRRLLLCVVLISLTQILNAQGWGQTQKIVASDRHPEQEFGCTLAIQGDIAAIGARSDGESIDRGGAVYMYEKDVEDNWVFTQKLFNSDPNQFDRFGQSVAIDGNYLIVGARGQDFDENGVGDFYDASGAAYIFERDDSGTWSQIQKLVASDRGASFQALFGETVAMHGNYAVVNAPNEDTGLDGQPEIQAAGACYIFERGDNGIWQEVQKIVSSDRDIAERWGDLATAISGDILVVGSYLEGLDASGENEVIHAGAAYIFERDTNGVWNEIQKIVASDREQSELFGRSVTIDGDFIVVGASQEYPQGENNLQYGAVYVFERDDTGVYNEVQKVRPDALLDQSRFGHSVDIDGDRLLVGANLMTIGPTVGAGAAFMFEKDEAGVWSQTAVMYDPQFATNDRFGGAVAVQGDFAMVGALQEDEDENGVNPVSNAGSAYVFDFKEPNTLEPLNTLSLLNVSNVPEIKTYPNPTKNTFYIDLGGVQETNTITVTNMLGQTVLTKNYTNTKILEIDFQEQPKGMYVVELSDANTIQMVLKVVKW